jgi:serine/threonine protein phosphatase PrpC
MAIGPTKENQNVSAGLTREEMVSILGKAFQKGQPVDADRIVEAITELFQKNNEKIAQEIGRIQNKPTIFQ